MPKIRAMICDDHPIFREGVRMIIRQSQDISLDAEAAHGDRSCARSSRTESTT